MPHSTKKAPLKGNQKHCSFAQNAPANLFHVGSGNESLYGLANMTPERFKKPIVGRSKTWLKNKPFKAPQSIFGARQQNEMYYNTLFI